MLKGKKLKLPDRLGSLVTGFDEKDEDSGGSGSAFDSGEELEPNGFGSDRESQSDGDGEVEEEAMVERKMKVVGELEHNGRQQRHDKDGSGHFSVMKIIEADEKKSDLVYEISHKEINLEKLQRIASTGIPEEEVCVQQFGRIQLVGSLLLGYLPPSRDLWEKELTENRQKYANLKEELLLTPSELARIKEEALHSNKHNNDDIDTDGPLTRHEISHEDHPLSLGKACVWHQYFEHTEITEQIDRDLRRTHPEMKFFSGESSFSRKHRVHDFSSCHVFIPHSMVYFLVMTVFIWNTKFLDREAMRNILILFSKFNPAIRYVQGMNEVLAPIYYVFSTDTDEKNAIIAPWASFRLFLACQSY
ncbi:hypothetical protein DITRI_Ditri10aG0151600 [Diplodiscus trichospermus]